MAIIVPYLDFDKKRLLLNSFFISQFNYCRLTWMCHNCTNNSKINRLYDRYLRLIYFDRKYSFEELLEKDNSVSIHYINLRVLAVEMYNAYLCSSKVLMSESFPLKQETQYRLRNLSGFYIPQVKSVNSGIENIRNLGSKI